MKDQILSLDIWTPLVGNEVRVWVVDCSTEYGLDPKQHHVYLENSLGLFGAESASIASGLEVF